MILPQKIKIVAMVTEVLPGEIDAGWKIKQGHDARHQLRTV